MKLSLSEISTVGASFAEDVEAYAAAGFDAIGIWEFKLPADDEANIALLAETASASRVACRRSRRSFRSRSPAWKARRIRDERIAALCGIVRRFAAYEPECVAVPRRPARRPHELDGTDRAWRRLQRVGAAAASRTCGRLRAVTPRQRESAAFVNSIAEALALLDEAGLDEVGILMRHLPPLGRPRRDRLVRRSPTASSASTSATGRRDRPHRPRLPERGGLAHAPSSSRALRAAAGTALSTSRSSRRPSSSGACPVDEAARRAYAAAARRSRELCDAQTVPYS